jgi:UDP-N-acetylmuramoylalanine--D-glutamate ligase
MKYKNNKKVAIFGFGITGKAVASFLISKGYNLDIYDEKRGEDFNEIDLLETKGFNFHFNSNFSEPDSIKIDKYDFVVLSPGISTTSPLLRYIMSHNTKIHNDITLFIREWKKIGPIIGITGSNGKSTVSSLLYESLKDSKKCIFGGNIGNSPLDMLNVKYEKDTAAILEISSSQLEMFDSSNELDICLITNISSNHLDRYSGDMNIYAETKLKGVGEKTKLILCSDDQGIQDYIYPILSKRKKKPILVSLENDPNIPNGFNYKKCNLIGVHNLYNISFVIEIMNLLNIPFENYVEKIYSFKGLEHRIEKVNEIDGVLYVNDSKSTSPQSTMVALEALGKDKNITLIMGGVDKGMDFRDLKPLFEMYVRNLIILPGDISSKIKKIAQDIDVYEVSSMKEAITKIKCLKNVSKGSVALLSPGAGSRNLFKSFTDRGQKFKEAIFDIM